MQLMTRMARTMLVSALVTVILPGLAGAQLTKAGVVTTLQGTATVARAAAPQPVPLKFKDTVFVQDRITTGDDSVARILLGGKAIVTVRERSVLTITEMPGTSTIDLGIGKIALAVVKERMKSGETIEIRTPNAVAGIRGTVVITEVDQKTAQLGAGSAAFTSRFTVLQGVVAVSQYNPVTRQLGPTVNLGALQSTGITGSAAPRPPVTITPEAAKQLASEYKTTIKEAPPAANAAVTNAQVKQAVSHVGSVLGPKQESGGSSGQVAGSGDDRGQGTSADDRGQGESRSTAAGVGGEGPIKGSGPASGGGTSGGESSNAMGISSVSGVSGGEPPSGRTSGSGISGSSSGSSGGGAISGSSGSSGGGAISGSSGSSGGGGTSGSSGSSGGGAVSRGSGSSGGGAISGGGIKSGGPSSGATSGGPQGAGGGIKGGGISGSSGSSGGGGISGGGVSGGPRGGIPSGGISGGSGGGLTKITGGGGITGGSGISSGSGITGGAGVSSKPLTGDETRRGGKKSSDDRNKKKK